MFCFSLWFIAPKYNTYTSCNSTEERSVESISEIKLKVEYSSKHQIKQCSKYTLIIALTNSTTVKNWTQPAKVEVRFPAVANCGCVKQHNLDLNIVLCFLIHVCSVIKNPMICLRRKTAKKPFGFRIKLPPVNCLPHTVEASHCLFLVLNVKQRCFI